MATKRTELQRLLSKRGIASRTKASVLIREGKVTVNGKILKDPFAYVDIESLVTVNGNDLQPQSTDEKMLIAFHKPKGVITTASDEKGRKTVYDVLPQKYHHLKAIGRLDMATSGLLLFTNDSILADRLLDPKSKIPRTYVVTVRGQPSSTAISALKKGVTDGPDLLKASDIELRKSSGKESILIITLMEGKNREIRRMCKMINHEVIKLKRISFGEVSLNDLPVGAVKKLPFASTFARLHAPKPKPTGS